MDDYRQMYYRLFNKMTDLIGQMQMVQQETEELFLSQQQSISQSGTE